MNCASIVASLPSIRDDVVKGCVVAPAALGMRCHHGVHSVADRLGAGQFARLGLDAAIAVEDFHCGIRQKDVCHRLGISVIGGADIAVKQSSLH
jgi:hypothetical protein